jgi:1-acyl-sn-glycerol-3-phosphate acyltransferase
VGDNHAAGRSLERAVDAIRAGAAVGIFPEGGVDWQGRMQPFHRGAAVLALWTGAPLVPAFIAGSHEVLPKGALIPRPRKVRVVAGAPIVVQPQNLHDIASEEISELTRRLQETIAALGRELLGDHPSTVVPAPANREVPPTVTPGTENPPGFRAEESS